MIHAQTTQRRATSFVMATRSLALGSAEDAEEGEDADGNCSFSKSDCSASLPFGGNGSVYTLAEGEEAEEEHLCRK